MEKKFLTKLDFQTGNKLVEVEVPQLGGSVFIKNITVLQRSQIISDMLEYDEKGAAKTTIATMYNVQLETIALSVVDQEGKPIFTLDEVKGLSAEKAEVITLLFKASNKVNAITSITEEEVEKK